MAEKVFDGEVKARIVDVRFALSGKVVKVLKKVGDKVGKGELIASLDKTMLQAELDRQLADYEKVRADFEIFNLQKGEPQNDLTKYLKTEKQAQLNVGVKEVEIAKAKLDQADLFSPVEGIILDDSSLVSGIYITPASGSLKVLDTSSYYFEIEVNQKDLTFFEQTQNGTITFDGLDKQISAETSTVFATDKGFLVILPLSPNQDLLLGLKGKFTFES